MRNVYNILAWTFHVFIGYGNIVPVTFEGRLLTIFFAIFSIPVNYWYIFKLGSLFAGTVMTLVHAIRKKLRYP